MAEAVAPLEQSIGERAITGGDFALALIQRQIRRLGKLQVEVVADRDPEPLHQLRVSLRRLRTGLTQFAPALVLPENVHERRIASVARRTGLCRDLDVLGQRLRDQVLPRLPEEEQHSLAKAMKRLSQDRAQAFDTLLEALHSSRYLKLLERLHHWQKKPRFTPLGLLPLIPWLVDWQAPFTAGLFLHPGWLEEDPGAETLHDLRKRIKQARYSLESLEPWCAPPLQAWIQDLRQAQDHLGELHDLQVLHHSLEGGAHLRKASQLPVFRAELESQQQRHWLRWRELAQRLHEDSQRKTIQRQLLEIGTGSTASI
ncbi:MAG: CHAD domain-containing protein [Cyanobacteriota bacterium]|nr:CHAD domain-containing protein [Cyanobacteriota bacterium]